MARKRGFKRLTPHKASEYSVRLWLGEELEKDGAKFGEGIQSPVMIDFHIVRQSLDCVLGTMGSHGRF